MFHKLLDVIFPEQCILCGELMKPKKHGIPICKSCARRLLFLREDITCKRCGTLLTSGEGLCVLCQTHRRYFSRAVACFPYAGSVRDAVLRYKFGGRRDYCRGFSALIYHRILSLHKQEAFDCVLCVPMTKASLRERGYHQTALLAERVAKALAVPFYEKALVKVMETPKQSTLGYVERLQNVAHAFRVSAERESLQNKNILLIDDVLTTGATADSISKLLQKAGAKSITVSVVASTALRPDGMIAKEDEALVTY